MARRLSILHRLRNGWLDHDVCRFVGRPAPWLLFLVGEELGSGGS
jgi:hypothetical protein